MPPALPFRKPPIRLALPVTLRYAGVTLAFVWGSHRYLWAADPSRLPFFWVGLAGFLLGVLGCVTAKAMRTKLVFSYLSAAFFGLSAAELGLYVWWPSYTPETLVTSQPFAVPDSEVGWRLNPNTTARASRVVRGRKIYDVTYHTDALGNRTSFPSPRTDRCVFFLGCSYVFGSGLEEEQTLPYQAGKLLGEGYRTYNYGVGGYGTHQLLRRTERGDFARPECAGKPVHAILVTSVLHPERSAGRAGWESSPRYTLSQDGLRDTGPFGTPTRLPHPLIEKSLLLRQFAPRLFDEEKEIYERTIVETIRGLRRQYPQLHAYVYSTSMSGEYKRLGIDLNELEKRLAGLAEFNRLEQLSTERLGPGTKWAISRRFEGHPNEAWNRTLAAHVVERIRSAPRLAAAGDR